MPTPKQAFSQIYRENYWTLNGMSDDGAKLLREWFQENFHWLGLESIVDIGSGPFLWQRIFPEHGIPYTGVDVVPGVVWNNQNAAAKNHATFTDFQCLDAAQEEPPGGEAVLCRSCLVHLDLTTAAAVAHRIAYAGSRFLFVTHFPAIAGNEDIMNGQWRPLNMTRPPFNWPEPDNLILDWKDWEKYLGLWDANKVREHYERQTK